MNNQPIVFFDGDCSICNGLVSVIQKRTNTLQFASLQSKNAKTLLGQNYTRILSLNTVVLFENNSIYLKSEAVLRISRLMHGIWPLMGVFRIVPVSLRDKLYDIFAHNRYRWNGHSEACKLNHT
jgi:predicted DCC family thiol-disulfide oxidoreductase YuxK